MDLDATRVFALGDSLEFGAAVTSSLGVELAAVEEHLHEDGEHKLRPLVTVRGCDVYVILSLAGSATLSVHDKLCRLLFFAATLRDAGAARVTLVMPYLCYARKDSRVRADDPVTTRYLAQLVEAMGVGRVVTIDVHNVAAFENAFRCETVHLEARLPLARAALAHAGDLPLAVASPDIGGVKRAEHFRIALEQLSGREAVPVFMEKHRIEDAVSGDALVGPVRGRAVVIVDDMMVSGTTLRRAVDACRARGAARIIAAVTHGVFATGAEQLLGHEGLDRLLLTNSVAPRMRDLWGGRVQVVAVESLVADALGALHDGRSVSALLEL
ncbi:MAG: ribose-phosphate diphosphokinase [Aquisalimonadaceae bacterium]